MTGASARTVAEAGLSFVPGDRHRFGLVLPFAVEDNLVLTAYHRPPFAQRGVRDEAAPGRDVRFLTLHAAGHLGEGQAHEIVHDLQLRGLLVGDSDAEGALDREQELDRKSTRLNSSHRT